MNTLQFPSHWSRIRKLLWLKILSGASAVWSTISGNPVSFTAKAAPLRQLSVAFSPVQDLHGYDSPWPAGGGKNKYGGSALKSSLLSVTGATEGSDSHGSFVNIPASTAINDVTLFDGFAENTQYTIILKFLPTGAAGANVRVYYTDNTYQGFSSSADGELATVSYTTTAGKTVVAIKLGYWYTTTSKIYYDDCGVFVGANQTFSPYSNLCPILGWDSLTVEQRGKNLYPYATIGAYSYAWYAGSTDIADATALFYLKGGKTYRLSYVCDATDAKPLMRVWHSDGTILYNEPNVLNAAMLGSAKYVYNSPYKAYNGPSQNSTNICVISPTEDLWIDMRMQSGKPEASSVMLNIGDTASEYVPYNPLSRSISISLGSTVYGGTLDVLTGVVTVDMASVDMGSLGWTRRENPYAPLAGTYLFYASLPTPKADFSALCSEYKWVGKYSSFNADKVAGSIYGTAVAIRDDSYTDAATFKTAMSGVQLVYELATPLTIQLTPQEVQSLAGDNVLFSDANGDLTVTYRSN